MWQQHERQTLLITALLYRVSVSWPDVPEQTTQSAEELEANMDADADFIARLPDLPVYEDLKAAAAARQAAKPEQQKGSGQDSDDAQQAADAAPALDALGSTAHDSAAPADAVDAAEEQEEAAELLPSSVTPVQIDWVPGGARWAEVSIGLLCGGDETHALPFSLRLRGPDDFNMALSDAVVRHLQFRHIHKLMHPIGATRITGYACSVAGCLHPPHAEPCLAGNADTWGHCQSCLACERVSRVAHAAEHWHHAQHIGACSLHLIACRGWQFSNGRLCCRDSQGQP